MKEVFADTGYWVASLDPRDEVHRHARAASSRGAWDRIVSSEWVLLELLNHFAAHGEYFRSAAVRSLVSLTRDPDVQIVPCSSVAFSEALKLYERRTDKGWSLTDCTSFLIMQQRGIDAALTFDRHFEQAGFQALMRS